MTLRIRRVGDGQIVSCPSPITAKDFLSLMDRGSATLTKVHPLRDSVRRTYRLIRPDGELLALEEYSEVYNTHRELVALSEPSNPQWSNVEQDFREECA